mmetsp:Transcript_28580/g.46072  ORF Transcript_28580/g.46072 Transcript_28580/m.46072 type:complete len:776 (+) Transcript_28580:144-2471(+)|eukprot:CAMPEP_0203763764 /NCGR_PEP_ID=MMETSP0098-20131031/16846_1 /ASSEMBLY_ACC=CAM_ASM_000208 /TAXON_ID=96639 /ORGANISM=" , Strain NY0313808BC1" /LENGTH=775 /DNA_ID=CAMNT_0050658971 /DNA_START=130 /DNA_END=2457 /DNA_ORIENTATION=-
MGTNAVLCILGALVVVVAVLNISNYARLCGEYQNDGTLNRISTLRPNGAREKDGPGVGFVPHKDVVEEKVVNLAGEQFADSLFHQNNLSGYDILVVGAGLSGTVLADLYARKHGKKVLMLDRRPHIGGNCYDFREKRTNILVNLYGAHLFHTNKEDVWKYVHRFSSWTPYEHRVVARVDKKLVPVPVNIATVNILMGKNISSTKEMTAFMQSERAGAKTSDFKDSREVGISRVGERLYKKLFREYTKKQWDVFPEGLKPEVLSRIPVREDWDDRYFPNDKHQALPAFGYTEWFREALDHENIKVFTSTDYFAVSEILSSTKFEKTFFTGQIDQFFMRKKDVSLEPLQYRSIKFETIVREEPSVVQPEFVVNAPQFIDGSFTRTAEYKHMYHQNSKHSILIREYSTDIKDGAEPYYPFPTAENQLHFEKYKALAVEEEKQNNVHFVGRLANYKYFNMDDAINNALELYTKLEGRSKLDEAINIESKLDSTKEFVVHFVVVIDQGSYQTTDRWFERLLLGRYMHSIGDAVKVKYRFFIYNTDRTLDESVFEILKGTLLRVNLPPPRFGQDLFIQNVAKVTHIQRVWLDYFTEHSFGFGDSNVFLRTKQAITPEFILEALRLQERGLFQHDTTRASQPNVYTNDLRAIRTPTAHGVWSMKPLSDYKLRHGAKHNTDNNMLHLLPLDENGITHSTTSTGDAEILRQLFVTEGSKNARHGKCPARISSDMFVATDAIIRRMLNVLRTPVFDIFIPALRKGSAAHANVLSKNWFCMFYDML